MKVISIKSPGFLCLAASGGFSAGKSATPKILDMPALPNCVKCRSFYHQK